MGTPVGVDTRGGDVGNISIVAGRLPPWPPGAYVAADLPGLRQTYPVSVDPLRCSAKGCRNAAGWALHWNNPKLHTADRRKTWLACDEHRESLSQFLAARAFL